MLLLFHYKSHFLAASIGLTYSISCSIIKFSTVWSLQVLLVLSIDVMHLRYGLKDAQKHSREFYCNLPFLLSVKKQSFP